MTLAALSIPNAALADNASDLASAKLAFSEIITRGSIRLNTLDPELRDAIWSNYYQALE